MRMGILATAAAAAALLLTGVATATASNQVVVYRPGTDVAAKLKKQGVGGAQVFTHALRGFAGDLTTSQVANVRKDPDVLMVVPDATVTSTPADRLDAYPIPSQIVPWGVARVGATRSPTAAIDRVDTRVPVGVAVVDSGIQPDHPDLNVAGGVNCANGKTWADGNGHGTHVAGTIAALDNGIGVVGVAPGAPLYAVRVLKDNGVGTISTITCGLDWVAAHASTVRVANLSLGGKGADDGHCGTVDRDVLHVAVCGTVAAGVTVVVAAGNGAKDGATDVPGAYPEVIDVSAFADFDGLPGGLGTPDCTTTSPTDDGFASFSNFGAVIDLAAPGVCVVSTVPHGLYDRFSGTSMAAPHVSGAAALYLATHPLASPAGVRAALRAAAEPGPVAGDPDAFAEPILRVDAF